MWVKNFHFVWGTTVFNIKLKRSTKNQQVCQKYCHHVLGAPDLKTEDIFLGIYCQIWEVKTIKLEIKEKFWGPRPEISLFVDIFFKVSAIEKMFSKG